MQFYDDTRKKKFVPQIFTANGDITKTWYVYYNEPLVNGRLSKRIKVYGGINRLKTTSERIEKAQKICEHIRINKPVVYGLKKSNKKTEPILFDAIENMGNYCTPKTKTTYRG